ETQPQDPGDDFYMTATQMSYMAGLHPPESKVPVMDPYLHNELRQERWVNRASQRLADLAMLKYGSLKEFFRQYDRNFDGVLDFDEFSKGITTCQLDHLFPRSLQRTLFDRIDTDKSGTVELHEFASFLERGLTGVSPAKNAWQGHAEKNAERTVMLQPIQDHNCQRIKNKLLHCLKKIVPNSSAGLADSRTMYLKKQFAFLTSEGQKKTIELKDLARAMGPSGMNIQIKEEDIKTLLKEMDTSGDGKVTLHEFAKFINLDDDLPLYDPIYDGRRRSFNILQGIDMSPPPMETAQEFAMRARAEELHLQAVPSKRIDKDLRGETEVMSLPTETIPAASSPQGYSAPPDEFGRGSVVSMRSRRAAIWDLPPPTRHLSKDRRSLTSAMRSLPAAVSVHKDGLRDSFGGAGGPFAQPVPDKTWSSVSSSDELFSSLHNERMQARGNSGAGGGARTRKVPKPTWADIGHGGVGEDMGVDENSSFYLDPGGRLTTTTMEKHAPLVRENFMEPGKRAAAYTRTRPSDATIEATIRRQRADDRSRKLRDHLERIALTKKVEEVDARLAGERRVRGKVKTRLRYMNWVNQQDNWLNNDVPKLADYDRRQFPHSYSRCEKLAYV
ncbi:unnamed protein product, partial [Discosporangium mesarthrocarpum]